MRTIDGPRVFEKPREGDGNRDWRQIHSKCHRCCKPAHGNDRHEDSDWYKTLGVAYLHHANLDQIPRACSETEPCAALRDSGPCNQSAPLWSTPAVAPVALPPPRPPQHPNTPRKPVAYPH